MGIAAHQGQEGLGEWRGLGSWGGVGDWGGGVAPDPRAKMARDTGAVPTLALAVNYQVPARFNTQV